MNADRVWHAIDQQRLGLATLLDGLSDDEWRQPSLCAGWTVREVAAHLTLQQLGPAAVAGMMLRWRGTLERTIADAARRKAATRTTSELVAEIRDAAGDHRHTVGVTRLETLTDALVHGQDIAIPLGRELAMPPEVAAVAATRVLTMRFPPPLPAARKVAGFRLAATDTDWSAGAGPPVRGPMAALLLACTGRPVALSQLTGDGVAKLAAALG
ncbi:maleylpyruvate isomerase family mycothiol-dependent enzyme [Paractinoplanes durhamensis]|uniref:Mycothiol-dependent maleylpyruvate isomerase metal-binding domain-containing protein n=1 Tax=Paractinoplanes durhamensis TaxID=113563 RepID=A0ABQ3ZDE1_9ACTN|nr:maleylpyruvate isomerase family mycothiol-dependent enzyme [Actinoplanes durhamensis]GIE07863.1 hypothetical protein Adu01nite_92130 [Actinoplanes durhamensis]